jgi:hypothetical protein
MNPKPFWVLKNLTVPVAIVTILAYTLLALRFAQAVIACAIETSEFRGALLSALKGAAQQGITKT